MSTPDTSSGAARRAPLAKRTLFAYAVADMPVAFALFPVLVYIPNFYSSEVGIPLALVGTIMLAVRIFDFVNDPLMGYLSDHTRSRFGRRRPWIILATPVLMLAIYNLFLPPDDATWVHMAVWSTVLTVGTTMFIIPYYAWGAELTPDYHERTRVTGARAMAGITGSLLAQLVPAMAMLLFAFGGSANVLFIVGVMMLLLMPICVTATVSMTPEAVVHTRSTLPVLKGLRLMWENGPFKRLVLSFMLSSIGLAITTPLYIFFIKYVLNAEAQAPYMLMFFYAASLLSIPAWMALARRVGKHPAYMASFVLIGCAHPFYLLLGEGDFWWMLPITLATGIAAGGFSAMLPNAMKADVIDLDELSSGENRAAFFFSSWSFAQKFCGSFGGAIAIFGLAMFGFQTGPDAINGPDELFALRFLFSTFPSIFYLGAALMIWKYPITEARHAEIHAQLEQARQDRSRALTVS